MQLVDQVEEVADDLDHVFFFRLEHAVLPDLIERVRDFIVLGYVTFVLVGRHVKDTLRLPRQADRGDAFRLGANPSVFLNGGASDGRVGEHADDVNARAPQGQRLRIFSELYYRLHELLLQNKLNSVFIAADMPDGPQSGALLQHHCVLRQNVRFKLFQVLGPPQVVRPFLGLHELAVKVGWVFDCLVLLRKYLDSVDYTVQKELRQYIAL